MFRRAVAISAASVALAGGFSVADTSDARACGGAFYPPPRTTAVNPEKPAVVTDHRTVIALNRTMTTVWDQIEYAGDPEEFAWVLPVRGAVTVGLGNDNFLNELDKLTALEIRAPRRRCARPASGCGGGGSAGCSSSAEDEWDFDEGYQEDAGIFVNNRQVAGPYAAVQVHGADESAIVGWLRDHRFQVPVAIEPVFKKYIAEGFDFVAVRLRKGGSVGAMVPIRVSWKGLTPSLPLRMSAAGVDQKVGIKLFVIADARWKTKNFPTFSVDPSGLSWDFIKQQSNYVTVRDAMAATFDGRAFALESSIDVPKASLPFIKSEAPPAPDAAVAETSDAMDEASDADDDAAITDAAVEDTAKPEYDVGTPPAIDPYASDVEIAFGTFTSRRVTRLRTELPVKYLDQDLELEADENQETLDRKIQLTKATTAPVCPTAASIAGEGDSAPIRASIAIVLGAIAAVLARRASRAT